MYSQEEKNLSVKIYLSRTELLTEYELRFDEATASKRLMEECLNYAKAALEVLNNENTGLPE